MKKICTFVTAMLMAMGMYAGELTVADGTATNASLPVCSYYFDFGFHSQMLYGAEIVDAVAGSPITSLTFYSSTSEQAWGVATLSVKLAEVSETELTVTPLSPEFTEVFSGSCSIVGGELIIDFTTPFTYSGTQNLLLDIEVVNKGTASSGDVWFYGEEVTNAGFSTRLKQGTYTYSTGRTSFLPKTTFKFEGGEGTTCSRPSKLTCSALTPDGGVFTWEGEEEQYQWCVVEKDAEATGWALLEAKTYTSTGLKAGVEYDFYVRTYCSEAEQSKEAKVTFSPFCNAPAKVELSDLTHESATFSWGAVAGIEKYQFVCLRTDSTPEWESVEPKEVLAVSVDTLQPATSYNFYVRSWFTAENVSEATKLSFTTNCVAATIPFSEDFSSGSIPNCWEAGSKWAIDSSNDDHTTGGASGFLRYNAGQVSDAISASIELSENALLDFFYENRYNSSAIPFDIIVLDASNEAELLKESVTSVSPSSTWVQKTIDLSAFTGKIVKIKFHGNSNGKGYIRIDDVSVTAKPCETPKSLKAESSTTGAVVTWTAGNDEDEWNLRYKAVAAEEWTEVKGLTEHIYTIKGLVSDVEYEVQLQAACTAEKQSEWTASAVFTPHCPVPSKLAVKQIEDNRALVAWEGTESVFNLQYKAAEAEAWTTVEAVEAKSYTLTDLEASTKYQVKVQTACGSAFTNAVSFTTRCSPLADAIPYLLNMDSVAVGTMPECWFVLPRTAEVEVMLMNDDTHRLYIAGQQECWIVLPALDADLHGLTVSVNWNGSALQEIGYLTAADENTFVPLANFSSSPAECDLRNASAEAKYVAFHCLSTTNYSEGFIYQVQIAEPSGETAVENTTVKGNAVKRIENGVLVIEHNGLKYNAQGTQIR